MKKEHIGSIQIYSSGMYLVPLIYTVLLFSSFHWFFSFVSCTLTALLKLIMLLFLASRSKRSSTAQKSSEHMKREHERTVKEKEKMLKEIAARKNLSAVRRLTQEELLAEAKLTEQINIKSLGMLI